MQNDSPVLDRWYDVDIEMIQRGGTRIRRGIIAVGVMIPFVALVSAEIVISHDSAVEKSRFILFLIFEISTYLIGLINALPFIGLADGYRRLEGLSRGSIRTAGMVGWGAAVIVVLAASLFTSIGFAVDIARGGLGSSTAPIAYIFYLGYAVMGGIAAFLVISAVSYLVVRRRRIQK